MLLFDRLIPPAELAASVEAVDAAALRDYGAQVLGAGVAAAAVLGPKRAGAAAEAFLRAAA